MQTKIKKIYREKTICSYQNDTCRLQLVERFTYNGSEFSDNPILDYKIIQNRKIRYTKKDEYQARKIFAQMVTNIVLQLKIY